MSISTKIKILFGVRVFLWIIALGSTGFWIWYSGKLYDEGIFEPVEYANLLRPVLHKNLTLAIICICISFVLYGRSQKLKKLLQYSASPDESAKKLSEDTEKKA